MNLTSNSADLRTVRRSLARQLEELPRWSSAERRQELTATIASIDARHEALTGNLDYHTPECWR